eukprot:7718633-Pyramimonas_sp.AAC.1
MCSSFLAHVNRGVPFVTESGAKLQRCSPSYRGRLLPSTHSILRRSSTVIPRCVYHSRALRLSVYKYNKYEVIVDGAGSLLPWWECHCIGRLRFFHPSASMTTTQSGPINL